MSFQRYLRSSYSREWTKDTMAENPYGESLQSFMPVAQWHQLVYLSLEYVSTNAALF